MATERKLLVDLQRLQIYLDELEWNFSDFARELGRSKSTVERLFKHGYFAKNKDYYKCLDCIIRAACERNRIKERQIEVPKSLLVEDASQEQNQDEPRSSRVRLELVIEGGIEEFSQREWMEQLRSALPSVATITLLRLLPGSVRILLELDHDDVETLIYKRAIGELDHLHIIGLVWPPDDDAYGVIELGPGSTYFRRWSKLRLWQQLAAATVLAASLVVCGLLLGRALRSGDRATERVLMASATASFSTPRGATKSPQIVIHSPLSGFASVVTLARERRPLVYPRTGTLRVTSGVATDPYTLPEETTEVVFVITQTPAGETLRGVEDTLRDLRPDETREVREQVLTALQTYGFREMAIGEVRFSSADDQ